jgi:hypothetical protein
VFSFNLTGEKILIFNNTDKKKEMTMKQSQTLIPSPEEQADNPELVTLSMLEAGLVLCNTAMAAAKPEIAYGYSDDRLELNEPYFHAGKAILNRVDSLSESIAAYKNIICSKAWKNEGGCKEIPF